MLMGHPPHISTRGRENTPQGCFAGLTPVPRPLVGQERVASDAEGQAALAEPLAAVPAIAPAGPPTFPRVAVPPRAGRAAPRILAGAMVDRPLVIVSRGARVEVVCLRAELRPALPLGGDDGGDRRGADMLPHCPRDWRGWRVRGCLGAAVPHAAPRRTARLGRGATAPLPAALSGGAGGAFACPGQPWAARPLVALLSLPLGRQWAARRQLG